MPSRHDPLTGRTVLVAPGRELRPSDFAGRGLPRCPFCAGAEADTPAEVDRIGDCRGGDGRGAWLARVVPNAFPFVTAGFGAHEVVIESPRHATRFVDLTPEESLATVTAWARRLAAHADAGFDYALVFKNEGAAAGASMKHAHSQVVALPKAPATVLHTWRRTLDAGGAPAGEVVARWGALVAGVPSAPRATCEAWLAPAEPVPLGDCTAEIAAALGRLVTAIDSPAFNVMVQVPPRSLGAAATGRWWIEVVPRTASIAGFELATGWWINPVPPEAAAERLRTRLADA